MTYARPQHRHGPSGRGTLGPPVGTATVPLVDVPLWVTLLVAVLTAVGSYLAGIRPARVAARQAEADRDLARQERDDNREQWFIERIERAWELCRGEDEKDKRAGVRMLRAMIKEPGLTRLVYNILDEVAQEELGDELRDLRQTWQETGSLPDVDIVVMESDDDEEPEVHDGDSQGEDEGHPPAGGGGPSQGGGGPGTRAEP